jgi:putative DNA methylase
LSCANAPPEPGFLDEVYPLVEDEVRRQIASMQALDEDGEPNFNDADYQLAAYAAALKVLTQYATLDGRDVEHEVFAVRDKKRKERLPDRHRARHRDRLRHARSPRAG